MRNFSQFLTVSCYSDIKSKNLIEIFPIKLEIGLIFGGQSRYFGWLRLLFQHFWLCFDAFKCAISLNCWRCFVIQTSNQRIWLKHLQLNLKLGWFLVVKVGVFDGCGRFFNNFDHVSTYLNTQFFPIVDCVFFIQISNNKIQLDFS